MSEEIKSPAVGAIEPQLSPNPSTESDAVDAKARQLGATSEDYLEAAEHAKTLSLEDVKKVGSFLRTYIHIHIYVRVCVCVCVCILHMYIYQLGGDKD